MCLGHDTAVDAKRYRCYPIMCTARASVIVTYFRCKALDLNERKGILRLSCGSSPIVCRCDRAVLFVINSSPKYEVLLL